jgi:hypothetical protein
VVTAEQLQGAWELVSWDYSVDGELRGYAMGPDATGQLIYSPEGHMSAILSAGNRAVLNAEQFHRADAHERDRAALTYVSYGGTWRLDGDLVRHQVHYSLFPNWVGTELVRTVSWDDGRLVLTAEPDTTASGKQVVNRLVWRRA